MEARSRPSRTSQEGGHALPEQLGVLPRRSSLFSAAIAAVPCAALQTTAASHQRMNVVLMALTRKTQLFLDQINITSWLSPQGQSLPPFALSLLPLPPYDSASGAPHDAPKRPESCFRRAEFLDDSGAARSRAGLRCGERKSLSRPASPTSLPRGASRSVCPLLQRRLCAPDNLIPSRAPSHQPDQHH